MKSSGYCYRIFVVSCEEIQDVVKSDLKLRFSCKFRFKVMFEISKYFVKVEEVHNGATNDVLMDSSWYDGD